MSVRVPNSEKILASAAPHLRKIGARFLAVKTYLTRSKGLWFRIAFCWALGTTFLFFDEVKQYDLRYSLRGPQEVSSQTVIVTFDQEDLNALIGASTNWLRNLKETNDINDRYFWRPHLWNQLLGAILSQNPKAIGVTFFFSPLLQRPDENLKGIYDPRVIWGAQLDNEGQPVLPVMAGNYGKNVALIDLREDEDRILRRYLAPLAATIPHLASRLAESSSAGSPGSNRLINFRGPRGTFSTVSALSVFRNRVPPEFFKNKTVIIGSNSLPGFQTPVGHMNRAEILAQIVDNTQFNRWIRRSSTWLCSLYLLLVLIVAASILTTYPQTVGFVFLIWLGLGTTALSIWVFDSFCIWIPALSPLLLSLLAYVILIGYQLAVKENQTWRLEQEKRLFSELDQMRNNFVSLISHDLKTPIAKIQAICDRLLAGQVSEEIRDSLTNLRKESVELHRYIQSILQVSRLESNKVQLLKEPIDFNEVVEKAVEQIRPLADDKRQEVNLSLEPMFSMELDGILIQEVVLNLVENAVKYTPNDGRIEVKTQEVENKVVFTVNDSGPGVPESDRDHLFEKFYRGQARHSSTKGTGLGLFLVKYFIELHGGEVFLESEVGKGTKVGFSLPLEQHA